MSSTIKAAEKMLQTQQFYNSLALAQVFGVSTNRAATWLKNIKEQESYQTLESKDQSGSIKVLSINGRKASIEDLQTRALLFKRPSIITSTQI
jgi:23S rRNA pseudoU1915 N3-methylase RlmH